MIENCGYCRMDTAGNHEFTCPLSPHGPRVISVDPHRETNDLHESCNRRIAACESELRDYGQTVKRLNGELAACRSEVQAGASTIVEMCEMMDKLKNELAACRKELAEAQKEIETVADEEIKLAEARGESERIKHNASRLRCERHKADASNAWGCPGCVEELRAELEAKRLKWQTGPVSERGYYIANRLNEYGLIFVVDFISGHDPKGKWAGPIELPEE